MRAMQMYWLLRLFFTSLLVGLTLALSTLARGAGVVGNGTPVSCTEAALAEALQGGGPVSFAFGAAPVEIVVTHRHEPTVDTQIDGECPRLCRNPKLVAALGHATSHMVVSNYDSFLDPRTWPDAKIEKLRGLYGWDAREALA